MNYKLYFLFIASLVIISCKTDPKAEVKPDVKPVVKTETTSAVNENTSSINKDGSALNVDDKPNPSIAITEPKIIDVSSIAEIVSKADHNTTLRLKKGAYQLPDNLAYFISKDKKEVVNKKKVESRAMGGQLYIIGMTNFSIIGNGSEIYSSNPLAVPLFIVSADHGEFKNLTLGHKGTGKTLPSVPSLYISNSNNVNISNCNLGNKSKSGIKINISKSITITDCNISNSHNEVMEIYKGESIQFVNSVFKNNKCAFGCFRFIGTENSVEFNNVNVIDNRSIKGKSNDANKLIVGSNQSINFSNSEFSGNKTFSQTGLYDFQLVDCEVQKF
jgi:hypothetical protein